MSTPWVEFGCTSRPLAPAIGGSTFRPPLGEAGGLLVGVGLKLESLPIVTTRWGEWEKHTPRHDLSSSLDTGYDRDYGEGRAYRDYFSNDKLMFQVPERDNRLRNKAEVLGILLSPASPEGEQEALAVSARFLQKKRVFGTELAGRTLTIVTSPAGANRVFDTGDRTFSRLLENDQVVDDSGKVWKVTEDALVSEEVHLKRVPAYRAFWFGWFAQFPGTRLIR